MFWYWRMACLSKVVTPPTNPITKARKIEVYIETDDAIVCIKSDNLYDLAMECFPMFADIKGGMGGHILSKIPTNESMCQLSFKTTKGFNVEYSPFIPEDK